MPIQIGDLRLFDVEELASLLQVHEVTIRRLLRLGKLPGRKFAKKWYVSEEALQAYFREPEPHTDSEQEEEPAEGRS